jgi:hypothetical protein
VYHHCGPPSSRSSGDDRRNENDNSKRAPDPVRVQQGAPNRTLVVVSLSRTIHLWELPNIPTASALSELQFVVVTLVAERPSFASDWAGAVSHRSPGVFSERVLACCPRLLKLCLLLIIERRVEGRQSRTHTLNRLHQSPQASRNSDAPPCAQLCGGDGRANQGRENGGADRQLVKFACHSKSNGRVASSRPNGY